MKARPQHRELRALRKPSSNPYTELIRDPLAPNSEIHSYHINVIVLLINKPMDEFKD